MRYILGAPYVKNTTDFLLSIPCFLAFNTKALKNILYTFFIIFKNLYLFSFYGGGSREHRAAIRRKEREERDNMVRDFIRLAYRELTWTEISLG